MISIMIDSSFDFNKSNIAPNPRKMTTTKTARLLSYFLLICGLSPTPSTSHGTKMVNISFGTSCNITDFQVNPGEVFNVETLASMSSDDNEFVDCEISFTSSQEDGRLCVIQDGPINEIRDSNVEMVVKDNVKTIFELKYYPSRWLVREYCSKSPALRISLKKINKNIRVDISKVVISLKIADISSKYRTLYFNDISCTNTYQLRHSSVSVYNRSPNVTKTEEYCGLKIEKESKDNTSICLVYRPLSHQNLPAAAAVAEWRFAVSTESFNLDPQFFIYHLSSNSTRASRLDAWCADPGVSSVTLILHRLNLTIEPHNMFVFTLTDYPGSNETFLALWNSKPPVDDKPQGAAASTAQMNFVIPIAVVVFIVSIVMLTYTITQLFMCHYCKKVTKVTNLKIDYLDTVEVLKCNSSEIGLLKDKQLSTSVGSGEQNSLTEKDLRKKKINDDLLAFLQRNPQNGSFLKQKPSPLVNL